MEFITSSLFPGWMFYKLYITALLLFAHIYRYQGLCMRGSWLGCGRPAVTWPQIFCHNGQIVCLV